MSSTKCVRISTACDDGITYPKSLISKEFLMSSTRCVRISTGYEKSSDMTMYLQLA